MMKRMTGEGAGTHKTRADAATKKGLSVRDIMTLAAMLVLALVCNSVVGALAIPFPGFYLYIAAGLGSFLGATFYLVTANRVNKHGLLLIWATVQGVIYGLGGYFFLIPYFFVVGLVCELAMIGTNSYRKPVRNAIGWSVLGIGMIVGNALPVLLAASSFPQTAKAGGFSQELVDGFVGLAPRPALMLLACAIAVVGSVLGVLFGQRGLRRAFRKAGVLG